MGRRPCGYNRTRRYGALRQISCALRYSSVRLRLNFHRFQRGRAMKRKLVALIVGCSVFALTSNNVWAQATAQISGTAKDRTGAVLPGVEITATQTATAATRTTVTNETGSFVLSNLPIGPYRVEASLPGFRTFAQTGIVLEVNASPVINPVLEVGQVSDQIEVKA